MQILLDSLTGVNQPASVPLAYQQLWLAHVLSASSAGGSLPCFMCHLQAESFLRVLLM